MPPTRGHDLKQIAAAELGLITPDAPHTGARLETESPEYRTKAERMPPTRGHDLKPATT